MTDNLRIWPIEGDDPEFGSDEWEVVEVPRDHKREPRTLMISTLEACRAEYPDAVVEA